MTEPRRYTSLLMAIGAGAVWALSVPACLDRREPSMETREACSSCHGDATRPGSALLRAAPPHDLAASTDTSYPGVGAHQIHLQASETHAAVACDECHLVPERTDSPGHADTASPAELTFGVISRSGGRRPSYTAQQRCSDTYCHRDVSGRWTAPRDAEAACGSCHGLPPRAPHPSSPQCFACHGDVVDAGGRIIAPERHVDGVVDYAPRECVTCHGSGDDPAPPADTRGNRATTFPGVGAHQAHLRAERGRALACTECHRVPSRTEDSGHVDGVTDVALSGVATALGHEGARFDAASGTCADTHCHGPGTDGASPAWTSRLGGACSGCHEMPPRAPHPQIADCSICHGDVVAPDDASLVNPARHVDGTVDVDVPTSCTACHGRGNPAPPRDTTGGTATSLPGVGAHQSHLGESGRARPVPCDECHVVPSVVRDPGHIDTAAPAEVRFAGAAVSHGGTPAYAGGRCSDTSCHGARFPDGHDSGGSNRAPRWTQVDGTEATCGSCHALPPPAPHPKAELNPRCSACHENVADDGVTFVRPELHVDGRVTFEVR